MTTVSLSVFDHGPAALTKLREVLHAFEEKEKVSVQVDVIPWDNGWQKLIEFALYHHGPDISEVGSTWIMDLVRMGEVRPFPADEVTYLEGNERLFEVVWNSARTFDDALQTWAIPWAADPRVVFYRREVLEKVGVAEQEAFTSIENFEATLQALTTQHKISPLALPTRHSRRAIHNLASWIWQAGGDFLHPRRNVITFDQPEAMRGIQAYFRLGNYLDPRTRLYTEQDADQAFWSGKAAATVSGFWILSESRMPAEVRQNLGVAPLLNIPFVGGSHLIVWKSSHHAEEAVKLIHFLLNDSAATTLYPLFGLPVRLQQWKQPPFDTEPYRLFLTAIQRGRFFSTSSLWGLVEKRLVEAISDIWEAIADRPAVEAEAIIRTQIETLAYRLRLALEG